MKKYIVLGALAAMAVSSLYADDSMATKKTSKTVVKKSISSAGPVDRELEVRIGPRLSWLDGDVRVGKTGTTFSIWDDLNLDEPSGGVQFNVDWQPINRWHLESALTWDKYDHSGTTARNLSDGENTLVSGAAVVADVDAFTFELTVGYDLLKNNTWRIRPYFGGKGAYADGSASFTGAVLNSAGATVAASRTKSANIDDGYGLAFGGVDSRAYISRDWYVGGDIGASGWENWAYLTGDAYTGYDFSKSLGVRVGYAYDYVTRENDIKSSKQDILLGALYAQFVWGF
jgi:hypothetical protein